MASFQAMPLTAVVFNQMGLTGKSEFLKLDSVLLKLNDARALLALNTQRQRKVRTLI